MSHAVKQGEMPANRNMRVKSVKQNALSFMGQGVIPFKKGNSPKGVGKGNNTSAV